MYLQEGDLIITDGELAALAAGFKLRSGKLSALPDAQASAAEIEGALRDFSSLEPRMRAGVQDAAAVLANPAKVVQLHQTVSDDTVSRSLLAQATTAPGLIVELAGIGASRRLRLRGADEMRFHLQNFLAANESLGRMVVKFPIGTEAAITFLAVLDHFRYARLHSQLTHREPARLFCTDDVKARLQEAGTEDFRWPLLFLAKLVPLPVPMLSCAQDPKPALDELVHAGLVGAVEDSGNRGFYELTEAGCVIGDGLWHDVGKVGASVTAFRKDGAIAHDVALLVRSPQDLFAFYLTGSDATVCAMGLTDLDGMLQWVFGKPLVPAPSVEPPPRVETLPAGPPPAPADRTVILEETVEILPLCLLVEAGGSSGKKYTLIKGGTLGRQVDNDIMIEDPSISRKHVSFTRGADGAWVVTDLGSSNGTFLNGSKLQGPTPIALGDGIGIGQAVLRVVPDACGA